MNNKKITRDQIDSLPDLTCEKSVTEIAQDWGVTKSAVLYWVKQLRKRGHDINVNKRGGSVSLLDKNK